MMKNLIKLLKAISDPVRLQILRLLKEDELCVCEIVAVLKLPQPTVSNHLKILVNAELIKVHKQGTWAIYNLCTFENNKDVRALLRSVLNIIEDTDDIAILLKKLKHQNKAKICD
jgi:ArsR family transcriptional regulator, arsenate/arsenite/antimonite-responsive transcriptional repressor